jgi:hypothetical protein
VECGVCGVSNAFFPFSMVSLEQFHAPRARSSASFAFAVMKGRLHSGLCARAMPAGSGPRTLVIAAYLAAMATASGSSAFARSSKNHGWAFQ